MEKGTRQTWEFRLSKILSEIYTRATRLAILGYTVYGTGSFLILWLVKDKALATVLVMFFFQLLVIYFGTREMYPCIAGGFRAALEANRDSVPLFEKLAAGVEAFEKDPDHHPLVKTIGDRIEKAITEKVGPAIDTWTRVGERIEKIVLPRFEEMITRMGGASKRADRIGTALEEELSKNTLKEIKESALAIRTFLGPAEFSSQDFVRAQGGIGRTPAGNGTPVVKLPGENNS